MAGLTQGNKVKTCYDLTAEELEAFLNRIFYNEDELRQLLSHPEIDKALDLRALLCNSRNFRRCSKTMSSHVKHKIPTVTSDAATTGNTASSKHQKTSLTAMIVRI